MTTAGAASDENFVKMTSPFQWKFMSVILWFVRLDNVLGLTQYIPSNIHAPLLYVVLLWLYNYHELLWDVYDLYTHIGQDYLTGTGAIVRLPIVRLPQCQSSNPYVDKSIDTKPKLT